MNSNASPLIKGYPLQIWYILLGMFLKGAGRSMVWPFVAIYMRQQMDIPLTTVTLLLFISTIGGMITTGVSGLIVDTFGRKITLLCGYVLGGIAFVLMINAQSIVAWASIMFFAGASIPLTTVSGNAIVADLVKPDKRTNAYALMRTSTNVGVTVGPSIGGLISSASYPAAFLTSASILFLGGLIVLQFIHETMPMDEAAPTRRTTSISSLLIRNRTFMTFIGIFTLCLMCRSFVSVLLPVYAKESHGLDESYYGFIAGANGAMVVLFQVATTKFSNKFPSQSMMALGSFFYAIGVGSVFWGKGFSGFLLSMIIVTIGEMLVSPTSVGQVANWAPIDMRGRYLGWHGLARDIGYGIGPVLGGVLSDQIDPQATWIGGGLIGIVATIGFLVLHKKTKNAVRQKHHS